MSGWMYDVCKDTQDMVGINVLHNRRNVTLNSDEWSWNGYLLCTVVREWKNYPCTSRIPCSLYIIA
jgi:hypothetical protein